MKSLYSSSHCKLTIQCMRTEKSRANFNALMSVVTTVGIDESKNYSRNLLSMTFLWVSTHDQYQRLIHCLSLHCCSLRHKQN